MTELSQVGLANANSSIGAILIGSGKLSIDGAERIIRLQKEENLKFGEAAVALGLLSNDDIRFALSRQFDYPYLQAEDRTLAGQLIAAYNPFAPVVEQLRALRTQLMFRWMAHDQSDKILALTGADRGSGRSFVAANLAIVFSQLGERTLLIDADLRSPTQHHLFNIRSNDGLTNILAGRSTVDAICRIPGLRDMSVLPAGPTPPNPQELIGRSQFGDLMDYVGRNYDVVILDTPAHSEGTDALMVAARARSAVVVARKNHTEVRQMRVLKAALDSSNVEVLSVLLNDF